MINAYLEKEKKSQPNISHFTPEKVHGTRAPVSKSPLAIWCDNDGTTFNIRIPNNIYYII